MHFVFVNYSYSPGFNSPESWTERIKAYTGSLECLAKYHKVSRVEQIAYEGEYRHNGVEYYFTDFKKHKYIATHLNRFVKSLNPDIVIVEGLLYPLQVLQLRLMLPRRVPIIAQHHAEQPFRGLKKIAQQLADRCITAYFFAAKDIGMDWVNRGIISSAEKLHEVMEVSSVFYPVDKFLAKEKTGISGEPVFLWVGRLNANKDPLLAIRAFLHFVEKHPDARLYMIYHTEELLPDIKAILKDHLNRNTIVLVGKVPNPDLLCWYNSADFILSCSQYEGSGTAVCEAMSCGCIPVVTNIASFRVITDNGNCGWLFPAGDEGSLLFALNATQYLNRDEKRQAAINYFHSNLSFEAIAKRMENVAVSLLK